MDWRSVCHEGGGCWKKDKGLSCFLSARNLSAADWAYLWTALLSYHFAPSPGRPGFRGPLPRRYLLLDQFLEDRRQPWHLVPSDRINGDTAVRELIGQHCRVRSQPEDRDRVLALELHRVAERSQLADSGLIGSEFRVGQDLR